MADAAQHVDDRQFFLGIAQGLGLSPVALRDDWQAALGKYLADVSRSMMTPVVAIDNAQHLSEKRLAILLQLYSDSMIDGRATLRLVLFGEKSLSALFEKEKEPGSRLSFREFELHPFTREQSDEYIRSRLKVSNDLREDLLSDAWLEWAKGAHALTFDRSIFEKRMAAYVAERYDLWTREGRRRRRPC